LKKGISLVPNERQRRRPEGFSSRAVHIGERPPHPDFNPTTTPIYATTSFSYDSTAELDPIFGQVREGYVYSRYGNPTTRALESVIADLEGTEDALMYATGMAAIFAALTIDLKQGDAVVAARDVYGATYSILANMLPNQGIKVTLVDARDLDAVRSAVQETRPKLLFCETVSNPLVRVANLPELTKIAHEVSAAIAVDNTFPTPVSCNPASFGVDMVLHSTTKYFGGHGDATGGVIATTKERADRLRLQSRMTGATISPFEAWLTLRGIKTLALRFERQCANAENVAAWLARHPRVSQVNYPGFQDLGDAAKQFTCDLRGAMLSFDIREAEEADVNRFMDALSMIVPATTLGDVFTLTLYPANTSHRSLPPEAREAIGIGSGLVRLSIGIEDVDDITADLEHALALL
jgi:cystathionine beta-lyase/cystathionine gamma-synthase